ncbi:MAG: ABC transporter substrate-binding protein [Propionivibrio sp.]|uniref:CmpA/NrtA family ABC transporter substrate-binding protein n=1 Tax=Propionivibrio sp. TaxID=2212460 RepID=UPI001A4A656A|nr:CmpA/NrtA family ABC transporter substrate-binding protein [Propionivibrio sp.]MBL8414409.1 ABC transporter substrate-binding protein [Propionivibrio sp.]
MALVPGDVEGLNRRVVQGAVMRALFPDDIERRRFLSVVGASTAWAAISSLVPFGALEAMAQEKGSLEKKSLKIGFIPITCASPLIMADPLGFYKKQGLDVTVIKTAGWALIRDKVINKEYDASHMLAPMPISISMGVGSNAMPVNVATIQNVNGQAITLHVKHKDKRDPKQWKGFKFAVPFEYSMHNFLLRYYVAEHGLDPEKDIQIRVVPPPEMVANLRAGNLDGYLGPDPFNQRAVFDEVGFIHLLSKEIWDGHPCCSFGVPTQFIKENPNTFAALYRAVLTAAAMANDPKNRSIMAEVLSPANYLNQPKTVLEQVLTGKFADGLGGVQNVPDRAGFDPFPWYSMAVWILTQMKRWGYIKGEVKYRDIAEQVYLVTDARKRMSELGMAVPAESYKKFKVMGKEFDPAKPDAYVASFAIRRS